MRRSDTDAWPVWIRNAYRRFDRRDQRCERVDVKVVADALHHGRDTLESCTGVNAGCGQRHVRAIGLPIELHEHEIPDLNESPGLTPFDERVERKFRQVGARPLASRASRKRPVGGALCQVDVDLAAGTAGSGVGHLPEVVFGAESVNAAFRHLCDILPELSRFVIVVVDGHEQSFTRNLQFDRDELPRKANCVALEVVAERKIAEHLEERMMPGCVSDLLEIVVLATRPHAFLRCGGALAERCRFLPEEHALELDHSGVREQQRRIVRRHKRGRWPDGVLLALEVGQESGTDLGREHMRQI